MSTQTTILNLNNLGAGNHNGGGLHFGPDGKLYVGVGENASSSNAQLITNLLGKILRVNPDPLDPIPSDNPTSFPGIIGSPTGNNRAIWAVGLRNPFTTVWSGNRYIINDVGANTWEEINDGIAGRNYGWPSTEGDFNQASFPNFTRPVYSYQHGAGVQRGNTIIGGALMNSSINSFPAPYQGKYFFGDYINNWIAYIDLDAPPTVNNHTNFTTGSTDIVDMKVGPDGAMYWLGGGASGNGVRRILPTPASPQVTADNFLFDGVTLPGAPHRLEFTFNTNVRPSLTTSDLTLTNTTTSTTYVPGDFALTYDYTSNVVTFTFPGLPNGILPDGNYTATLSGAGVFNALGQSLPGDAIANFFVLSGDANHDTFVNANDFSILATNFGQSGRIFSQGDFNYDGIVNANDFAILATKFGTSLAPAATGTRSALASPRPSLFASDQKVTDKSNPDDSGDLFGLLA